MANIQNVNVDVDIIYNYLSTKEKYEMLNLIMENGNFNVNHIYDSLSHSNRIVLSYLLYETGYFKYDEPKIKCDKNNLNNALLSILDKSHMLTKTEIEHILNIANKYKYFK